MFSLFDVASVVNESWCIVLPHTPDGSDDPLRDEYDRMIVEGIHSRMLPAQHGSFDKRIALGPRPL